MTGSPIPRVVIDTNACLDLFVFEDPACAALAEALARGRVAGVTDAGCRDEWVRVLAYPKLRLDAGRRAQALAAFDAGLRAFTPGERQAVPELPRCRDPDDQKFLELAARCGAAVLVTRDASLLRLSRRTRAVAGFVVMSPSQAIALLGLGAAWARDAADHAL